MTVLAPLVKSIEVACERERAFEVFTRHMDSWWPRETHSLGERAVEMVAIEGRVGGRIFERWQDGTECEWGEVEVWDPPHRLAFTWLPNPERRLWTEVEVTFEERGANTLVTLEHRGWETADASRREDYDTGWERVLSLYAARLSELLA